MLFLYLFFFIILNSFLDLLIGSSLQFFPILSCWHWQIQVLWIETVLIEACGILRLIGIGWGVLARLGLGMILHLNFDLISGKIRETTLLLCKAGFRIVLIWYFHFLPVWVWIGWGGIAAHTFRRIRNTINV